jgi:hypothetical protein
MNWPVLSRRLTDTGLNGIDIATHELAINNDAVGARLVGGEKANHYGSPFN